MVIAVLPMTNINIPPQTPTFALLHPLIFDPLDHHKNTFLSCPTIYRQTTTDQARSKETTQSGHSNLAAVVHLFDPLTQENNIPHHRFFFFTSVVVRLFVAVEPFLFVDLSHTAKSDNPVPLSISLFVRQ